LYLPMQKCPLTPSALLNNRICAAFQIEENF